MEEFRQWSRRRRRWRLGCGGKAEVRRRRSDGGAQWAEEAEEEERGGAARCRSGGGGGPHGDLPAAQHLSGAVDLLVAHLPGEGVHLEAKQRESWSVKGRASEPIVSTTVGLNEEPVGPVSPLMWAPPPAPRTPTSRGSC